MKVRVRVHGDSRVDFPPAQQLGLPDVSRLILSRRESVSEKAWDSSGRKICNYILCRKRGAKIYCHYRTVVLASGTN